MTTSAGGMFSRMLLAFMVGAQILAGSEATARDHVAASFTTDVRPLLTAYCATCHNAEKHKGDVDFSSVMNGVQALGQLPLWLTVGAKLLSMDMPPVKSKQPSQTERVTLLAWVRTARHLQAPDPGNSVIRRLSRAEYDNTMRDLFYGADLNAGVDLPTDNPGEGFDNSLTPLLMEKYLLAADDVLDHIVVPDQMNLHFVAGQLPAIIAGKPDEGKTDGKERFFTTPGEVVAQLTIPTEGIYTVRVRAGAEAAGHEPIRLAIRFDSLVVGELKIMAPMKAPAQYSCTTRLATGRTKMSLIYVNPTFVDPPDSSLQPAPTAPKPGATSTQKTAIPPPPKIRTALIEGIDIIGPPAKPPSEAQRKVFVAAPGKEISKRMAAKKIVESFALRAYRRPLLPEESNSLLGIFDLVDAQDLVFSESVKMTLKAVLISPQFLYRTPDDSMTSAEERAISQIGDYDLASRLSYFLWQTMPDDELFTLAHAGTLHDARVLKEQVLRLMKDPRSKSFAEMFAGPWLGVDKLMDHPVDEKKFPLLTKDMRQSMYEEAMTFFLNLLRDGGSILDFIDCDYAYINGTTAKIYGISGVSGSKMQKTHLDDVNRGGLVTMPGILTVNSMSNRTSPVKRGKWVLEQLLNAAPPPPPPNVPDLDKQNTPENVTLTLRQKTERHRLDPACAVCHVSMDPIGFGLENYDAIGRWRDADDAGNPIDSLGELPDGTHFSFPSALKKILLDHKEQFVNGLVRKLLAFALGRRLGGYDEVVIDDIVDGVVQDHYRFDALIVRIVSSYPFLHRRSIH